jgi:hypothetical protein
VLAADLWGETPEELRTSAMQKMVMADKHSDHKQGITFLVCQLEHEHSKICHGLFLGSDLVEIKWRLGSGADANRVLSNPAR